AARRPAAAVARRRSRIPRAVRTARGRDPRASRSPDPRDLRRPTRSGRNRKRTRPHRRAAGRAAARRHRATVARTRTARLRAARTARGAAARARLRSHRFREAPSRLKGTFRLLLRSSIEPTQSVGAIAHTDGENEMKRKLLGLLVAGAMAASTLALAPAYATSEHAHGHADTAQMLKLDHGRKWASDEAL